MGTILEMFIITHLFQIQYVFLGLAYSLIIGLPPIFGIYTGIVAPLIYAILGTSRHASTGFFMRRNINCDVNSCQKQI